MNIARGSASEFEASGRTIAGFIRRLNDSLFQAAAVKVSEMDWNVGQSIRSIWESCDLSASEFADEVAAYYQCPRMTLPELLAVPSLVGRFTRRFLLDAVIFPYDVGGGFFGLAVADPTDVAAQRGAEIVLGGPVAVSIASFEDIAAALSERLGSDEDGPSTSSSVLASGAVEESVDSLRDLASGAPVVRAVNDLLDKAVELRASDIHIEPMRNGLTVRMRVDGLLRAVPAPAHALPQKARLVRGGFDMRVGRTGVAVRFRSEGARIDLNAAPSDLLTGLLTAVGVDPLRAETFAECVVGWRTKAKADTDQEGYVGSAF
jgi:MshEN domain